jgi:uncharacterized YigZ family protein
MIDTPDTYYTVAGKGESVIREKASKFIGLAFPINSETEAKEVLLGIRKKYYDANHHCYAYCFGLTREIYRLSDDGEPSGSAGRPIHGQLLSKDVSDTLVIVVRYFGGTKLGIPGLITAYRQAASEALDQAGKTERIIKLNLRVNFPYEKMNEVMKIQKEEELDIVGQVFDNDCSITLAVRKSKADKVLSKYMRISNIYTLVDNQTK